MRHLTAAEREVLRAVVLAGARRDEPLRAALLAQVAAAQVTGPSCTCGCASVGLVVQRDDAPPASVTELSADAAEGDWAVGFRLLLVDGYLDDVEFYGYGDADDTVWPAAHLVH
jgi:hypothetical protein